MIRKAVTSETQCTEAHYNVSRTVMLARGIDPLYYLWKRSEMMSQIWRKYYSVTELDPILTITKDWNNNKGLYLQS